MTEEVKVLGKIGIAKFGQIPDYPYMVGLQLCFSLSDDSSCCDGGIHTVNTDCKNNPLCATLLSRVNKILNDAKVTSVDQLVGIPVEVTLTNHYGTFKEFRILTEVL